MHCRVTGGHHNIVCCTTLYSVLCRCTVLYPVHYANVSSPSVKCSYHVFYKTRPLRVSIIEYSLHRLNYPRTIFWRCKIYFIRVTNIWPSLDPLHPVLARIWIKVISSAREQARYPANLEKGRHPLLSRTQPFTISFFDYAPRCRSHPQIMQYSKQSR